MPSAFHIRRATDIVRSGGVIAYPTEAVYGLGCDPADENAVERLLEIKQRPREQGLIVIAAGLVQVEQYLEPIGKRERKRLKKTWPGPQTWLIPAAAGTPDWLTGRHNTLAVRVTDHPVARALCRRLGHGLVSTSANRSSYPPARDALTVRRMLGDELDYILSGPVGSLARPTPIRDLVSGDIIRA